MKPKIVITVIISIAAFTALIAVLFSGNSESALFADGASKQLRMQYFIDHPERLDVEILMPGRGKSYPFGVIFDRSDKNDQDALLALLSHNPKWGAGHIYDIDPDSRKSALYAAVYRHQDLVVDDFLRHGFSVSKIDIAKWIVDLTENEPDQQIKHIVQLFKLSGLYDVTEMRYALAERIKMRKEEADDDRARQGSIGSMSDSQLKKEVEKQKEQMQFHQSLDVNAPEYFGDAERIKSLEDEIKRRNK